MSPEERREKSNTLAVAINAYLEGQGFVGVLGDWILLGSVVRVDEEGDPDCQYFIAFAGGGMLQHHALGLLAKADDLLTDGND